jgi:hypothetical protein
VTRFVGLNNRVIAGMLLYIERKNLVECDSNRFEVGSSECVLFASSFKTACMAWDEGECEQVLQWVNIWRTQ